MSFRGRFAAYFSAAATAAVLVAVIAGADTTPAGSDDQVPAPAKATAPTCASPDAVTGIPPEVRLRKLHLVRPDLIPYPIAYEIYC